MAEIIRRISLAFARGAGSALDITGISPQQNNNRIYQAGRAKSVQEGIRQDWKNVGKDISSAISTYRK